MVSKMFGKKLFRHWFAALLTFLGAVCGYLYYRFAGCAAGSCIITSNPLVTSLYGGAIGFLIGVIVTPNKKEIIHE